MRNIGLEGEVEKRPKVAQFGLEHLPYRKHRLSASDKQGVGGSNPPFRIPSSGLTVEHFFHTKDVAVQLCPRRRPQII